ncbi:prolipoprotein diacylglyceryl transferase [Jeotgalibacillus haloalkalitolerans]|uniref:Phosphatidylglycerol--prolipoprotein diacylglyceryl transferase n=1 Tax=Jeotgalibacillus haloalkalitolerans TaxID=3104292 RepID=A0ABU5KJU7_9BACL|nr:prolipoprotein diacylglyceryl transferase [Jeotgalibacillus sp. HH7-29]MDZ5711516.1 prolipoprotein diacylglyceryl transferase [Jeotgalibacillus sp. HH7-29]
MLLTAQPIDPVAFSFGPLSVAWYGLIIGTGIVLGYLLANREADRLGMPKDMFADLLIWAVPIAIISARIYYVIFQWDYFSQNPGEIVAIWNGGIAIHGALIGSVATGFVFAKRKGLSFWKIVDIAAPSIILGQMLGRWGNFINQEAHGGEVSRSFLEGLMIPEWIINQMYIEVNGSFAYYHPTFLYESVWNFIGLILLLLLRKVNPLRGEIFLSYVIWYSIGRAFVEGLRTDSLMLTETIRVAQAISILLVIVAVGLILYRRFGQGIKTRYADKRN